MAGFDFANAQPPQLLPLGASHEENEVEAELKALTMSLWDKYLADRMFDANVLGMAHLGSYDLVRRSVTQDGLALLPGVGAEPGTRYLYRAMKARNHQGRGLHFIKTYLQIVFPGVAKVEQLWMAPDGKYPDDAYSIVQADQFVVPVISDDNGLFLDGTWNIGGIINTATQGGDGEGNVDTSGLILLSRVRITLDFGLDMAGMGNLIQILRSVMPARLVPEFQYAIEVEAPAPIAVEAMIEVEVQGPAALAHPELLLVTDDPDVMWCLGSDDDPDNAPRLPTGRASVEVDGT